MAKPIALTPPITGKAAIAFNEKAERKAADELFDRVFDSYRPSTAPRRTDAK